MMTLAVYPVSVRFSTSMIACSTSFIHQALHSKFKLKQKLKRDD
jgi:hypothetical protein